MGYLKHYTMNDIEKIFRGQLKKEDSQIVRYFDLGKDPDNYKVGLMNMARYHCPNFEINGANTDVINLLFLYFSGQKEFIEELKKYNGSIGSLDKGILLTGGVGSGKSMLFKIMQDFTRFIKSNYFVYEYAINIVDSVSLKGAEALDDVNNSKNVITMDGSKPKPPVIYIDDIASKNEVAKHYGTEFNVIEHLLLTRYNIMQKHGILTHASSNKYAKELVTSYDLRVVDRMKEMFNIIELKGKSFRK